MKQWLLLLVIFLSGCQLVTSTTVTISEVADPVVAILKIDGIVRDLGFHHTEVSPIAQDEFRGLKRENLIVKGYETIPMSRVFVIVKFDSSNNTLDVYFAERADSFSILALEKRDILIKQITLLFGQNRLNIK